MSRWWRSWRMEAIVMSVLAVGLLIVYITVRAWDTPMARVTRACERLVGIESYDINRYHSLGDGTVEVVEARYDGDAHHVVRRREKDEVSTVQSEIIYDGQGTEWTQRRGDEAAWHKVSSGPGVGLLPEPFGSPPSCPTDITDVREGPEAFHSDPATTITRYDLDTTEPDTTWRVWLRSNGHIWVLEMLRVHYDASGRLFSARYEISGIGEPNVITPPSEDNQ